MTNLPLKEIEELVILGTTTWKYCNLLSWLSKRLSSFEHCYGPQYYKLLHLMSDLLTDVSFFCQCQYTSGLYSKCLHFCYVFFFFFPLS